MGFFAKLFQSKPARSLSETRRENGVVTYELEPRTVAEAGGVTITSNLVINKDEETAELHKEATRWKREGDWDKAVAALQKAQARMRQSSFSHTPQDWVRLPLFLQQAGRFVEAEVEFQRLLDDLPNLARSGAAIGDRSVSFGKGTSQKVSIT